MPTRGSFTALRPNSFTVSGRYTPLPPRCEGRGSGAPERRGLSPPLVSPSDALPSTTDLSCQFVFVPSRLPPRTPGLKIPSLHQRSASCRSGCCRPPTDACRLVLNPCGISAGSARVRGPGGSEPRAGNLGAFQAGRTTLEAGTRSRFIVGDAGPPWGPTGKRAVEACLKRRGITNGKWISTFRHVLGSAMNGLKDALAQLRALRDGPEDRIPLRRTRGCGRPHPRRMDHHQQRVPITARKVAPRPACSCSWTHRSDQRPKEEPGSDLPPLDAEPDLDQPETATSPPPVHPPWGPPAYARA